MKAEMNIKMVPLHQIKPYENNVKQHPIKQLESIVQSIKQFGFRQPLVLDKNNVIVCGHARYEAAATLGLCDVPCELAEDLTEEQINAYRILDNEIAKQGTTDFAALNIEMAKLPDFDFKPFNLDIPKIEQVEEGLCDADDVPEITVNPKSKLRDVWLMGEHRLMCGDSTMIDQVEKLMNGERADMVFTDPPYNIASDSKNYAANVSNAMNELKNSEWDKDFNPTEAIINAINNSKDSATYYIWTSHFLIQDVWDVLKLYCDFWNYIVWSKPNPMPSLSKRHPTWNTELCAYGTRGSKRIVNFPIKQNFLSCREVNKKSDGSHPTQKPIELIEPLIEFSSGSGQLILDLFGGSGSTLIACEKTNRKCLMMEISPAYCDVIINRWQKFTGKDAVLEGSDLTYNEVING